jgi:hypothetical protein
MRSVQVLEKGRGPVLLEDDDHVLKEGGRGEA